MVHTSLYCPEQISIPENFPNILKDYAKAALRTQPYDLLRWSATYFRCLQMGIPPPVKLRYEKNVQHGSVTKEYLRVLIKQVGKGFFISRLLLQQRWDGLCLPQDELFKYLSLCRMLRWSQIHWLKLFAVLVGAINKTPLDTLITLCELLTDNVDGAEAYVPMWMFRICYKFLAELDCSEEQTFIDGRKLLSNGELEDEIHMKGTPEICSPMYLRNVVLEECRNRYTEAKSSNENNVKNSKMDKENNSMENQSMDRKSIVSSEYFEFSKINGWDQKRIIDSYADFDSIILLLREAQGAKLHEYDGPLKVTQKHIRHAKIKQNEIMEERERQAEMYEEAAKHEIYEQQIKMIKELGPPWTWLHEFVSDYHCLDKSYNFIDAQSIISDVTPIVSSDESFDFEKEKPIADATSESEDAMTVISKQMSRNDEYDNDDDDDENIKIRRETNNDDDDDEIEKLLQQNTERIRKIEKEEEEEYGKLGPCLEHLRSTLSEIEINDGLIPETESVISFLRKEAAEVLERAGEKYSPEVDLLEIAKILEQAHKKGVKFSNLDEMIDHIRKVYPEQKDVLKEPTPCETELGKVDLTNVTKEVVEEECKKVDVKKTGEMESKTKEEEEAESVKDVEEQTKSVKEENAEEEKVSNLDAETPQKLDDKLSGDQSEDEIKEIRIQVNINVEDNSEHELQNDRKDKDEEEIKEFEKFENKNLEKNSEDNIRDAFDADGISADERLMNEKISEELILGLIPKPETPTIEDEGVEEIEESVITATSSEMSMMGNINDDSSLQPSTERSVDTAIETETVKKICGSKKMEKQKQDIRPNAFQCKIPPLPGIGKPVSKETMRNFLTFLKGKSQIQNGMICPRNFKDPKCPDIVDYED